MPKEKFPGIDQVAQASADTSQSLPSYVPNEAGMNEETKECFRNSTITPGPDGKNCLASGIYGSRPNVLLRQSSAFLDESELSAAQFAVFKNEEGTSQTSESCSRNSTITPGLDRENCFASGIYGLRSIALSRQSNAFLDESELPAAQFARFKKVEHARRAERIISILQENFARFPTLSLNLKASSASSMTLFDAEQARQLATAVMFYLRTFVGEHKPIQLISFQPVAGPETIELSDCVSLSYIVAGNQQTIMLLRKLTGAAVQIEVIGDKSHEHIIIEIDPISYSTRGSHVLDAAAPAGRLLSLFAVNTDELAELKDVTAEDIIAKTPIRRM